MTGRAQPPRPARPRRPCRCAEGREPQLRASASTITSPRPLSLEKPGCSNIGSPSPSSATDTRTPSCIRLISNVTDALAYRMAFETSSDVTSNSESDSSSTCSRRANCSANRRASRTLATSTTKSSRHGEICCTIDLLHPNRASDALHDPCGARARVQATSKRAPWRSAEPRCSTRSGSTGRLGDRLGTRCRHSGAGAKSSDVSDSSTARGSSSPSGVSRAGVNDRSTGSPSQSHSHTVSAARSTRPPLSRTWPGRARAAPGTSADPHLHSIDNSRESIRVRRRKWVE